MPRMAVWSRFTSRASKALVARANPVPFRFSSTVRWPPRPLPMMRSSQPSSLRSCQQRPGPRLTEQPGQQRLPLQVVEGCLSVNRRWQGFQLLEQGRHSRLFEVLHQPGAGLINLVEVVPGPAGTTLRWPFRQRTSISNSAAALPAANERRA